MAAMFGVWGRGRWLASAKPRAPGSMIFFSPKSEEAEDSDIQTMATDSRPN